MTYPNATNTGVQAGVNLTTHSGQLTLSTAGQVVSGLIITGGVQIDASNVTLKNCIIEIPSSGNWNVGIAGGLTGVVLQNCEIVGAGTSGPVGSYGIYVQGNSQVTINAVNIHDVGQGLVLNDGQVTLENSYIHDLNAGSGTHYEDVGYFGAAKSLTFSLNIQNNTLINQHNQTAAVFLQNYFGGLNNITVNNNVLVGGDYTIYVDGSASSAPVSNVSITNNHMGAGIYGITDFMKSSPVYTGNVDDGATLASALATGTTTTTTGSSAGATGSSGSSGAASDPTTTTTGSSAGATGSSGSSGAASAPPTKVIQTDGSTSLTEVGTQYYLYGSSGSGPALKYNGANVTAGEFGSWTPIGAVQTASGYDVAWKNTSTGEYTVWTSDSSGNYKGNIGAVTGTSSALESLEPVFHQDLNRDGVIGLTTKKLIQTDGSTSLTEVGNQYYLYGNSGSGPALKYNGANVTAGEFGAWTPIGAIQTASGYDIAWKNTSTGQYTVWTSDSNGNYKGNIGHLSGTSSALETMEPVFQQDLNRDGVIGLYAAPGTTQQIANALAGTTGSATIGTGATLELTAADSASVTFAGATGTLRLDHSSTFNGKIFKFSGNGSLSGSDHIDLRDVKYNSVHDSYANGVLTVTDGSDTAKLNFNGSYTLASFKFANDGSGGTIVYDPPAPPASGQSTAAPTTGAGETYDPRDLPSIAFNVQSTIGDSPDSNRAGVIPAFAERITKADIGLLGNYMASTFASASHSTGTDMTFAELAQSHDQSVLSNPHHV
jgi:Tryptophan-rich Synechocystis species C-terminal domain/Right handed beta helix region